MKILHINCNYLGTTLHQLMVEKLEKMGLKNKVYVPVHSTTYKAIEPNPGVCVSESFKEWDRLVFDYKQRKIYRDIQHKINIADFDCIHAYTLFTDGNTAMKLSKKYNKPYVVAVRNTDVNDFFRLMVHLRGRGVKIMRNASAIFFLSESYRKQVFEKYVPEKYREELLKKTYIIPNGIDDFWFENAYCRQAKVAPGKIKLIYAGRIDKNKNIPTTQRAIDILRSRGLDVSLTVVGKTIDKDEFEIIDKHSFTEYIEAKPKEELLNIYRNSDIFVMPSFAESFGLVYVEAMSQGLPVIYSKGQGFDGQFEDGKVGFAVDSASAEQIAEAIEKISANYASIAKNLPSMATKFNWDAICEKYSLLYQEIK